MLSRLSRFKTTAKECSYSACVCVCLRVCVCVGTYVCVSRDETSETVPPKPSACQTVESMHENTNLNKTRCVIGAAGFPVSLAREIAPFSRVKEDHKDIKGKKGLFVAKKCSRGTSCHYGCAEPPRWQWPRELREFAILESGRAGYPCLLLPMVTFLFQGNNSDLSSRICDNLLQSIYSSATTTL